MATNVPLLKEENENITLSFSPAVCLSTLLKWRRKGHEKKWKWNCLWQQASLNLARRWGGGGGSSRSWSWERARPAEEARGKASLSNFMKDETRLYFGPISCSVYTSHLYSLNGWWRVPEEREKLVDVFKLFYWKALAKLLPYFQVTSQPRTIKPMSFIKAGCVWVYWNRECRTGRGRFFYHIPLVYDHSDYTSILLTRFSRTNFHLITHIPRVLFV